MAFHVPPDTAPAVVQDTQQQLKLAHENVIDVMLANPTLNMKELAPLVGYSESWLYQLTNSDAFRARLATRKAEVVDPILLQNVDQRLNAAAQQSLDVIMRALSTETPDVGVALKTLEVSSKALGYGAKEKNVAQQVNFIVPMPSQVPDAAEWAKQCRERLSAPVQTVDVTPNCEE